ncbi:ABC transporter substrate-binding protein [Aestuariivirga sp.]|uniref:ABC transporter substrate-binding protein n=1 Tax=Aestuariivirga sp. TaxID=2650926 RepID=UPI00391B357D
MNSIFGLLGGAALAALVVGGSAWAGDSLTITGGGGALQESQRKAFFEPYAKETGAKITEDEYSYEIAKIRVMVESGSVTWDVVDVDGPTAVLGCAEGVLETLDWGKLGLDRSKFVNDVSDCTVPNIVYGTVFAYDESKVNPGPTTLADFFDLKTFPGKRGLWKSPVGALEWALIADGVSREEVYKVLATPEGQDRAFGKLDTIKAELVYWEAGAQAPQLLADGQVSMTMAWNGRIQAAIDNDKKPFRIVWDHQILDGDGWAIPKGAKNVDAAYRFIAHASQPKAMAEQTNYIAYGPANTDAAPMLPENRKDVLPTSSANLGTAFTMDQKFWSDYGDQLRERFATWVAQ